MTIPDELNAEVERQLNCAIHELVFAIRHTDQDELDDACTCLVQAQINIERVNEMLASLASKQEELLQKATKATKR